MEASIQEQLRHLRLRISLASHNPIDISFELATANLLHTIPKSNDFIRCLDIGRAGGLFVGNCEFECVDARIEGRTLHTFNSFFQCQYLLGEKVGFANP